MNGPVNKKGVTYAIMLFVIMLFVGCSSPSSEANEEVELHIMTAASMTDAMNELKQMYEREHEHLTLVPNYGSSGTLKSQIIQGAPADLFLSAAVRWMDELEEEGVITQRADLLRNELVLVTAEDSDLAVTQFEDLLQEEVYQLAIGEPDTVPAGEYARQVLEELGIYEELSDKLIHGSDVRQVLTYVETGNVDAGLVYQTDAILSDQVKIVAEAETEEPIIYPVGLLEGTDHPEEAARFYQWLQTDEVLEVFKKYGFAGA
ncbi:molybdate ABC transporter substrate-binding protein [Alkalihalobacillus oceani]|uniref:molybdate ABC transporter substrate-binding protein n=1 Tax=Halalkalibacter oceani TaxID=1653776 RepID=UPI00203E2D1E|nr:molybdate ABC transporter substrate-binding protein [Halalkalibacter oceani]MCM3763190.1 molybdate ABC transporter substrate-binding protein [Halalkalibacter oceani]